MSKRFQSESIALVLQGGGALGSYQAGAYGMLNEKGYSPDWVAGISIGAINGAIICGNPVECRMERLQQFWEGVSSELVVQPPLRLGQLQQRFSEAAASWAATFGVPGFFRPRLFTPPISIGGLPAAQSLYDTEPLRRTLLELIDFDFLNEAGPRLSIGAVNVETGNFVYFDSAKQRIGPEHVMASGALPPGFAPIEIDGCSYWDGGLLSNTPLQYVLEHNDADPMLVFQVDLFNAHGDVPTDLMEVEEREKDIRYSSRTRLTTDRYRQLYAIRAAAARLKDRLPAEFQDDPDLNLLTKACPPGPVTLVHLIHRHAEFERGSKDYEFSRASVERRWAAGRVDTEHSIDHARFQNRSIPDEELLILDLTREDQLEEEVDCAGFEQETAYPARDEARRKTAAS